MDWRRAKTILIVAFVLLDLFLLYQIFSTMQQNDAYNAIDKITDQQMNNLLAENRFKLQITKPTDVSELKMWQGFIQPINGWQKLEHGYQRRFADNKATVHNEKELQTFLKKVVPYYSEFHLTSRPKFLQGKWIYTEQIDSRPMFNGRLEVEIEGQQVRSLNIVKYQLSGTPKTVQIIDFNSALYNLINSKASKKTQVIKNVELGYRAQLYDDLTYFFVPVWRFQIGDTFYDVPATRFGSTKNVEIVPKR